jgi:hypothetical protein
MNVPLPGMPDNPEFTENSQIPRRAETLLRMLMDDFQRLWDMTMAHPSKLDGAERTYVIGRQVELFGQVYLLASLRKLDTHVANAVAAELADQWDTGDSLGEWMYQWRKELDAGRPLSLPHASGDSA